MLVDAPFEAADGGIDLHGAAGIIAAQIGQQEVEQVIDRVGRLDDEIAVHIGLAQFQIGIEGKGEVRAAIAKAQGDALTRPVTIMFFMTLIVDHAERSGGDDLAQKQTEQHTNSSRWSWNMPDPDDTWPDPAGVVSPHVPAKMLAEM